MLKIGIINSDPPKTANMEIPPECPMHRENAGKAPTKPRPNPGIGECPMHTENIDPDVNPLNMVINYLRIF